MLEELVPRAGWRTDVALFSSYSVDLVAVAALAMALAAEGDDDERMWKGSLARSCEKMRDRFRVVCQGGRVAVPPSGALGGLVVADQWVRQVPYDGNKGSWHAKLGIVRYVPDEPGEREGQARWLLWMGSRNLTRDTSWDSAMTATGRPSRAVDAVDQSVAEAAKIVAKYAALSGWTERVQRELGEVHWSWPADVDEVLAFRLWTDGEAAMGLPVLPKDSSRIVALCPFVNANVAQAIGSATSAPQRNLITTPGTLAKLAADRKVLKAFTSVHEMESATPFEEGTVEVDETEGDEGAEIHRGLHAKLLWARSGSGDELWLGSANLTRRGWTGSNAELVAHLRVKASVGEDMAELADGLPEVALDEIATGDSDESEGDELLDKVRNRIAGSWLGELSWVDGTQRLRCSTSSSPVRQADGAELWVRLLAQEAGDAVAWTPGRREVVFAETESHELTELVVLELRWKADTDVRVSWVERAVLNPPPGEERDREALGRLMGPRALLAWIRSILDEFSSEADESPWPEPPRAPHGRVPGAGSVLWSVPTLESVLRAWTRDPSRVSQVDRVLRNWASASKPVLEEDEEAAHELKRFLETWEVVRDGLGRRTD